MAIYLQKITGECPFDSISFNAEVSALNLGSLSTSFESLSAVVISALRLPSSIPIPGSKSFSDNSSSSSVWASNSDSDTELGSNFALVFNARAAAAGLEPTHRINASVPQNARRFFVSPSTDSITSAQ